MQNFNQIRNLLMEHVSLFEELIDFENKKLDAIAANEIDTLEERMKEEQVFLMRLKGLDQRREKLLAEINVPVKTFSELISLAEGEEKLELQGIFDNLTVLTRELKAATGSTKKYIDLHLHSLEQLLSQLGGESNSRNMLNPQKA